MLVVRVHNILIDLERGQLTHIVVRGYHWRFHLGIHVIDQETRESVIWCIVIRLNDLVFEVDHCFVIVHAIELIPMDCRLYRHECSLKLAIFLTALRHEENIFF